MSELDQVQPRPVVSKLAKVLGQIKRVPKNGRNDFHKYDYVMEADLADGIRDHLAEAGLMMIPSVRTEETRTQELTGRNGKIEFLVTVTLDITIIDGESGDFLVSSWQGQGTDAGDKAFYKAYTGAMKYFLLKTFLVPTGDDPEQDESPVSQQRATAQQPRTERMTGTKPAPAAPPNPGPTSRAAKEISDGEEHDALCEELRAALKQAQLGKTLNVLVMDGFLGRYGEGQTEMGRVPLKSLRTGIEQLRLDIERSGLATALRDITEWAPNPVETRLEKPAPHTAA